eukprot:gene191-3579_t
MWWGRIGAASIAAIGGMGYYWAEINNKKEKSTEESMPPVAMKEISSGDQEHTKKRHLENTEKYGLPSCENVVKRTGYIAGISYQTRTPKWVLQWLTEDFTQYLTRDIVNQTNTDRSKFAFFEDESVDELFRARLHDYRKSGYSRGHLAPASDNKLSEDAMHDTFSLSCNIVPQELSMNGCDWLRLERMTKSLCNKYDHVFVVSGPMNVAKRDHKANCMMMKYQVIGPSQVAVPTHMFKVIFAENENGKDRAISAFVMPNRPIREHAPLYRYQVPLQEIERSTGLRFFPKLDRKDLVRDICVATGCEYDGDARVKGWRLFGLLKLANSISELDQVWSQCESHGFEADWVRRMYRDEYEKRKSSLSIGK